MPSGVKAFVVPDEDGNYNVYINKDLDCESQRVAFRHEFKHIIGHHCYSDRSVMELENEVQVSAY